MAMAYLPSAPKWEWPAEAPEKRLVLSVSIGDDKVNQLTERTRARYAKRCGASCLTLRDYAPMGDAPAWEKLRAREFTKQGYRVLYVDSDVYIESTAPNLFDYLGPESLGICCESNTRQWLDYLDGNREHVLAMARTLRGNADRVRRPQDYYNSGVMMLPRGESPWLALNNDEPSSDCVYEQTWINLRIQEENPFRTLLPLWANNMTRWDIKPSHGQFIHAAGRRVEDKLHALIPFLD